MDRGKPPSRERTYYDDYPDYTRPVLEITRRFRERLFGRLEFLYGTEAAENWMPEFERILKVHNAHKPPEMIRKEQNYNPKQRFSQEHIFLITYADMVKGEGPTPLSDLHSFVAQYAQGAINTLHILPFFPYSSDRGFAIMDYRQVDERLGSWKDIRKKKRHYDLMFDAVLNHCSSRSEMFLEFLNGNPAYSNFFIAYESPEELTQEQRRKIFRPRTSDILTPFETIQGTRYIWTTFSPDQVDLNFRNPAVLLQVMSSLLFYIRKGADLLRLDAVIYIWAEPGTESVHLPQTHEIVKLLRDVVDFAASGVALVTETNVPHDQNISYFGNGSDEAHMVYNFALPPLVLYAFYTGDADILSQWAWGLNPPSDQTAFLNILDTHDGIGLQGIRGLLPPKDIQFLVDRAVGKGSLVSYKTTENGDEEPYEINSTWWSVLNGEYEKESLQVQIARYLASRAIALVLRGVPGIYIHGALGTTNDYGAAKASGINRDLNRGIIDAREVEQTLKDPASKMSMLFSSGRKQILIRRREISFHPQGGQKVLYISRRVFALLRTSPKGDEAILTLTGVTGKAEEIEIPLDALGGRHTRYNDLLSNRKYWATGNLLRLTLPPYGRIWLKEIPQEHSPGNILDKMPLRS
ncbi:MAG: sugar phosphorylase [Deltaproteobacteria bacterium]|nr:sugar phosphorylase [Deltaproteobacteria bacterium]